MTNEVYGTVELDVSLQVESDNETMGLLEANYGINNMNIVEIEVWIRDVKGKLHKLKVHNWDVNLDRFIGD